MSHTSGPWTYVFDHPDCLDIAYVYGGAEAPQRGTEIATLYCCKDRANARLIAAAPDLLDALKDILANTQFVEGDEAAARAAIAKAEGKS